MSAVKKIGCKLDMTLDQLSSLPKEVSELRKSELLLVSAKLDKIIELLETVVEKLTEIDNNTY